MLRRLPRGLAIALIAGVVVLLVVAVLGVRWWRDAQRSDLERAVSLAPATTERLALDGLAGSTPYARRRPRHPTVHGRVDRVPRRGLRP
ncbi:hypothetical protein [Nocardioides sp. B-3]|uniref:hypothetical protein n=1 Tax=Nocardioides sp. B-3 TaxID=2895565 RepID=UPI00215373E1|nr:hypothetical protein [Nocardioides sp. B-3]UUZ57610.1 hypothetical protein LP418_14160 [Nocardioides sp. B-3]